MLYTHFDQINYKNYDRFFVIGCSFTNWHWPTWANIIAEQYPHLQFYNYGFPGLGNQYVQTLLSQLQRTHQLGSKDLVGIMWSTFHRSISYRTGPIKSMLVNPRRDYFDSPSSDKWVSAGDMIHVQDLNSDAVWCDRGFAIRDCAIIDSTTALLQNCKFDAFQMMSLTPQNQTVYDQSILSTHKQDVYNLYSDLTDHMVSGNNDIVNTLGWHLDHITVEWEKPWTPVGSKDMEPDRHPSALDWCKYLEQSGFEVSVSIKSHCNKCDDIIQTVGHANNLPSDWAYKAHVQHPMPL